MNLKQVVSIVNTAIKAKKLPGTEAQYKMSAIGRKNRVLSEFGKKEHKKSAVLLLLYEKEGKVYFPLIQRHQYNGVHSGQVSFPGGKLESTDPSLSHTALRETQEEVGVKIEQVKLIGALTDLYIPPSNHHVHPYIGYLETAPNFKRDEYEVDEILETELEHLLDDTIVSETKVNVGNGLRIKTPYFNFHNRVVWGATAMMLNEFKELIKSH